MASVVLGADIPAHAQVQVVAHIATCMQCRQRLDDYAALAQLMPLSVPEVSPPAELRGRIVAAARYRRPGPQLRQGWTLPWLSSPWGRALNPVFGFVIALLIVWGGWQHTQIQRQQEQSMQQQAVAVAAFGNKDAQERLLVPTGAAPKAWGRVLISPSAPAVALYVKNLPLLPEGHEYQIWLVQNEQYIGLGTFTVDQQGRAWQLIQPAMPLTAPQRITITVEPTGGSEQPTSPEYLGNRL